MSLADTIVVDCIASVEIFWGLLINGFITVNKLKDWWNCRKMKPFDQIFLGLGLSRFFIMYFYIFNIISRSFSLNVYHIEVLNWMLNAAYLFLDFSSLWFSMWLGVLYYLKVAIFKNTLLIRIKLRISELVPYMIVFTVVISVVLGFVFAYNFSSALDFMNPQSHMNNNQSIEKYLRFAIPSYFFGHFLSFIIVTISAFFLMQTIFAHVKHIRNNVVSFTSPSINAHLSVIRLAIVLEVMTVFNLVICILFRFDVYDICNNAVLFVFKIAYPVLHSTALIVGNTKLKNSTLKLLQHLKECGTLRNNPAK
ncbi:hypothetical protein GDO78_016307 [Eleutherodactylus coqui]|uniref:Taste receptor type 2 n=1 Tax=Eleutherodactylus coqui TaxID=57060 RepID=A0A8J6B9U2_ELECQ|nr:hypothetical protein GDO78_016307 [Eleutherodactylus coqui]